MTKKETAEKKVDTAGFAFHEIDVVLETTNRLYGGIPQREDLLRNWIASKGPIPEESLEEKLDAINGQDLEELVDRSSTGFRSDGDGIYLRDFMIKQMLKEAGTVTRLFREKKGTKTDLTIGLIVRPERIHVGKMAPDGYEEFQGRVQSPQGPRTILSRKAYFEAGLQIPFSIKMFAGAALTVDQLKMLLEYAGEFVGLGSARSREAGKFRVTKFEVKPTK